MHKWAFAYIQSCILRERAQTECWLCFELTWTIMHKMTMNGNTPCSLVLHGVMKSHKWFSWTVIHQILIIFYIKSFKKRTSQSHEMPFLIMTSSKVHDCSSHVWKLSRIVEIVMIKHYCNTFKYAVGTLLSFLFNYIYI